MHIDCFKGQCVYRTRIWFSTMAEAHERVRRHSRPCEPVSNCLYAKQACPPGTGFIDYFCLAHQVANLPLTGGARDDGAVRLLDIVRNNSDCTSGPNHRLVVLQSSGTVERVRDRLVDPPCQDAAAYLKDEHGVIWNPYPAPVLHHACEIALDQDGHPTIGFLEHLTYDERAGYPARSWIMDSYLGQVSDYWC